MQEAGYSWHIWIVVTGCGFDGSTRLEELRHKNESRGTYSGYFAGMIVSEERQMHDRFVVLTTLLIVPLVAGCAQIKSFSVTPSIVCPGETVGVAWKASDKIALDAVPPLEGTGEGPAAGSRSFAPVKNTRFTIKVPGLLKSAQREWDVQVVPSQSTGLLGGVAQCSGSPQSVSTSFTLQQNDTSSQVRAVLIANNYNRQLVVSKEGIEVEIPPNGTTDRFKNVPVTGTWTVLTPLAPDEACDDALKAVKGRLTIRTQMRCEEKPNGGP